jgi:hypothetical protein
LPSNVKVIRRFKDPAIRNPSSEIDVDEEALPEIIKMYVVLNKTKARVVNMFSPKKNHA